MFPPTSPVQLKRIGIVKNVYLIDEVRAVGDLDSTWVSRDTLLLQSPCAKGASDSVPDGGLQAWTQVGCAFLVMFTTWGYLNSFGALLPHYTAALNESPSTISWLGSLQLWIVCFVSVFAGRAQDAGLFTRMFLLGGVMQSLGILTSSVCKKRLRVARLSIVELV